MAGKNTAVFGIYRNQLDVEQAVDALRAEGFRSTDISVLIPESCRWGAGVACGYRSSCNTRGWPPHCGGTNSGSVDGSRCWRCYRRH